MWRTAWLGVALLAACGDNRAPVPDAAVDREVANLAATPDHRLDLLFLIDDSTNLDNLNTLRQDISVLHAMFATLDPPDYDLHVAVATSDLGTTGALDPASPSPDVGSGPGSCRGLGKDGNFMTSNLVTGRFLEEARAPDGTVTTNATASFEDALGSLLAVGAAGCGFEQTLRAVGRALTNPANAGFRRDGANLAVIVLSDEDDCSVHDAAFFSPDTTTLGPRQSFRCTRFGVACDEALDASGPKTSCHPREDSAYIEPVGTSVQLLRDLAGDPRKLAVAAIVGPPTPFAVEERAPPGGGSPILALAHSCSFTDSQNLYEVADPAVRTADWVRQLGGPGTIQTPICSQDYRPQLEVIAGHLKRTLGDPCIDTTDLLDASPEPGTQPSCTVFDILDSDPAHPIAIPACPSDGDCFALVTDERVCATPDHLRVAVHRASPPVPDAWLHVRCRTRP